MKKAGKIILSLLLLSVVFITGFCILFDQAVLTRNGTIYRVNTNDKVVALTFDDGPSPIWTPQILDELKKHNVKATFFMIGKHVEKYAETVKRVALEGHEIGNHTYLHHVLIYYTDDELQLEIKHTESLIEKITGKRTELFRPPKAWVTKQEKNYIKGLGYKTILWTLNSKDWVTFLGDSHIARSLEKHIKPGYIILFHDSGGTFSIEGGDRSKTVKAVSKLIEKLKAQGYKFATISELLSREKRIIQ